MGSYKIWDRTVVSSNSKSFSWSAPTGNNITSVVINIDGAASGNPKNQYHGDTPIADINSHTSYSIPNPGNSGSYSVRSANTGSFYITVVAYYEPAQGPSTISAANITLGENSWVSISNTQGLTNLVHVVKWSMTSPSGAVKETSVTTSAGDSSAGTWISESAWLAYMPTNSTISMLSITCLTYMDGVYYGQSSTSCNVYIPNNASYRPVIGSFIVGEPSPSNWFNNKPWKNRSTVRIVWSGCAAQGGASLASWSISGDSLPYNSGDATYAASGVIISNTLQTPGQRIWVFTVTDTRGQSTSVQYGVTVADYELPTISSYSAFRQNSMTLLPDPASSYGGGKMNYSAYNTIDGNSITVASISIYYNGAYQQINTGIAQPDTTYSYAGELDAGTRYNVQFSVTDALGGTTTVTSMIDTAYVFMRWDRTLNSFGFGSYPLTSNGQNQVYMNPSWKLYTHGSEIIDLIHPVGSVYISLGDTEPSVLFPGTTWERISGRFLLANGTCSPNTDEYFGTIKQPGPNGWSAGVGSTGGEDFTQLQEAHLPPHTHGSKELTGTANGVVMDDYVPGGISFSGILSATTPRTRSWSGGDGDAVRTVTINASHEHNSVGSGVAHNNMPPYQGVNMWRRTA